MMSTTREGEFVPLRRFMMTRATRQTAFALFVAACGRSAPPSGAPAPAGPSPVSDSTRVASQGAVTNQRDTRVVPQLARDARPTVAVIYFNNGAVIRNAEFDALRK